MLINNQCSVYEDRPLMCNIDRMHDELDTGMTKFQWYSMNMKGCDVLKLRVEAA
jgi:Fe-S-cluster containining protein